MKILPALIISVSLFSCVKFKESEETERAGDLENRELIIFTKLKYGDDLTEKFKDFSSLFVEMDGFSVGGFFGLENPQEFIKNPQDGFVWKFYELKEPTNETLGVALLLKNVGSSLVYGGKYHFLLNE